MAHRLLNVVTLGWLKIHGILRPFRKYRISYARLFIFILCSEAVGRYAEDIDSPRRSRLEDNDISLKHEVLTSMIFRQDRTTRST
ncbi:hypothetical protein M434DRAFT_396719 [Hypoxylon sp. CO27-5]|nr:hypothetical protein M434DRAFT_396719 [Hypoxylon sp. CO27-5]